MKRATIGWAIANGLEALEAGNDVDNAPMRAINARLGYEPLPDTLVMRGPCSVASWTDDRGNPTDRGPGASSTT